ncbi:MAG: hypothetical protein HOD63_09135 [Bacteroidetes bacterium]|nr:hypothetical protein [Bacteroidota bacterium]MBT4338741.1 hypothetical protein [Bacteroidota bacterium]
MKKLIQFLIDHIKSDFKLNIYLYVVFFIATITFIAYRYDVNRIFIGHHFGSFKGILAYLSINLIAYYGVAIPLLLLRKKHNILASSAFWILSMSFLILIAFERGIYQHKHFVSAFNSYEEGLFFYKTLGNLKGVIVYFIPLYILKLIYDKNAKGLFGLRRKNAFMKPFVLMILIILPMVIWASFQSDFQYTYPIFKPWQFGELFNLNNWQSLILFEAAYTIDFITVELIYRGALVVGMSIILGKDAILPMVSLYVAIHFGKPLAETISSAFGGYILGVFALNLRNIWGGAFIHIGLALMMEAAAMMQHYLRS